MEAVETVEAVKAAELENLLSSDRFAARDLQSQRQIISAMDWGLALVEEQHLGVASACSVLMHMPWDHIFKDTIQ